MSAPAPAGRARRPMRTVAASLCIAVMPALAACTASSTSNPRSSSPSIPQRSGGPSGARSGDGRPGRLSIREATFGLPAPVQREVAAYVGRRIIVAGGLDARDSSTAAVASIDPTTGASGALTDMPNRFHDAAGAVIGSRLFVFGGGAGGASSDVVQALDPATGSAGLVARLPSALSDVSATSLGGEVYLVGGYDGVTAQRAILGTIDGRSFEVVGNLPRGLRYTAVAAAGDRLIVAGGETAAGPVSTVLAFDPATSKVTLLGHLPVPIGHASAFVLGGRVYVAGGLDAAGHAVSTITVVDPAAGTVSASAARLPAPVSDAAAVASGGRVWLLGGWRVGAAVADVVVISFVPAA